MQTLSAVPARFADHGDTWANTVEPYCGRIDVHGGPGASLTINWVRGVPHPQSWMCQSARGIDLCASVLVETGRSPHSNQRPLGPWSRATGAARTESHRRRRQRFRAAPAPDRFRLTTSLVRRAWAVSGPAGSVELLETSFTARISQRDPNFGKWITQGNIVGPLPRGWDRSHDDVNITF